MEVMDMESLMTRQGEMLQYVTFAAFLIVLALLEKMAPRARHSAWSERRRITNVAMTLLNVMTLGMLPVSFVAAAAWARAEGIGLFNAVALPVSAAIALNLLARGLISFVTHYLMHRIPLFWAVHRVHHLDTQLDVSTTVRFHPLEFFIGLLPGIPMVVAFGLSPWILALYELFDVAVTLVSHANVRVPERIDRWLRYLIVTPDLHRIHHSSWQPETDSNFSAVFPIWDVVFRTFRGTPRVALSEMTLGLEEPRDARVESVLWLLASPVTFLTAPGRGDDRDRAPLAGEANT
jgi:sterol desaturase/sphingolipid hydroxylase (fatty acid hydroxylase superfamily)